MQRKKEPLKHTATIDYYCSFYEMFYCIEKLQQNALGKRANEAAIQMATGALTGQVADVGSGSCGLVVRTSSNG